MVGEYGPSNRQREREMGLTEGKRGAEGDREEGRQTDRRIDRG